MFKNLNVKALGIAARQSEVIELALSYRFKGMDLDLVEFAGQVEASGLPHARRLIDSARIKIGSFRLPVAWSEIEDDPAVYQRELELLPKAVELAASVGCTRAVTTIAPASDERPYHENFEFHRKRLMEIAGILRPHGVRIGMELNPSPTAGEGRAFQFIHSYDALIQLVKMISAEDVGIVLDLWSLHVTGGDLAEFKKLPAGKIVSVILSDATADDGELDDSKLALPGESGIIDCAAVLAMLAEMKYDGPVTPRAGAAALQGKSRDAKVKLAAERLTELWKQAGLSPDGKLSATASK